MAGGPGEALPQRAQRARGRARGPAPPAEGEAETLRCDGLGGGGGSQQDGFW